MNLHRTGTHDERLILARRSANLLRKLASHLKDTDPLASAIWEDCFVQNVEAGKHELPIPGVAWLRVIETQVRGGIDWYSPSLLLEIACAFETHIGGPLPSDGNAVLARLQARTDEVIAV